jgi:hypothetical protein
VIERAFVLACVEEVCRLLRESASATTRVALAALGIRESRSSACQKRQKQNTPPH